VKLEDWNKLKTNIVASIGDQGKITQLLADAETEVTTFNTRFSELEKQTGEQASHIDSLQKTNMNLFLRVGNPVQPTDKLDNTEPLTYDKLLEGMIK
jgi:hypothetical protein